MKKSGYDITFNTKCETYIGSKGYTILKESLTNKEIDAIKSLLVARPKVMGSMCAGPPKTFSIFRESTKKIYTPRYFGEKYFGVAKSNTLPMGDPIDVEFKGLLRPHQVPAVNSYLKYCENKGHACGLLELDCAAGKTVLSLNLISQLKLKTLIIVNKEFLLNQWIERITEFLPTARVGRIQGSIIDVENKDIVIGMLQSLSMKEYPSSLFESFGFTILDEVHHISSEVFSNALFKIVTRYMVGLSATMERKDGTTEIFKMFLGDVVYKGIKTNDHNVLVRSIEFKTNDAIFNETEVDFRGNPQYSKMIVKLCDYKPRSDFIVRVICDLLEENPTNQIIILGHNRSILYYLHDEVQKSDVGTVGYYLGGMKQILLDESSKKQIIFASYAMAAEGLDIATLSTLIFVTPKTDIVQSVGRILRTKHSNPIVVDIVDKHDLFQNQWNKRKTYYKKSNYNIKMINTDNYSNMMNMDNWKNVFEPKKCSDNKDDDLPDKSNCKCLIDVSTL
jgi:superfamily II DNA or RNA helicase